MSNKTSVKHLSSLLLTFLFLIQGICLCHDLCSFFETHDDTLVVETTTGAPYFGGNSHTHQHSAVCKTAKAQTITIASSRTMPTNATIPPAMFHFEYPLYIYPGNTFSPYDNSYRHARLFLLIKTLRC